jgi:MFS superfamily sulfate permease-like transporter
MRRMIAGLPQDALVGLLLAAIAIPEQLATARLAGMPPEAGLLTFAAGALGFAIFGTNRFLSAGADSTIAPIFAGGLIALAGLGSPNYAALASLLAVMVGLLLIGAALLRASWVADLLSVPVIAGFMAGVSVHIIVGQLPSLLGIPDEQGALAEQVVQVLHQLPDTNPYALAIGAVVFTATQVTEKIAKHLPGALLGVVAVAVATAVLHLRQHGVDVLGALPATVPKLVLPARPAEDVLHILPLALIVALVCMMQTAAVLRAYPSHPGGPQHVARDFGGIGAGCVLAGLIGGFAVNASPPRTAVVVSAGGGSQAVSLVAVVIAVALLFGGGWLLAFVPHAALAGVLIAVALRIFRLKEIIGIARRGGSEIWLVAASTALVVGLPIETGMLASIVLSLLHSFYAVARPLCVELARAPGTTVWWPPHHETGEHEPGVLVFAPAAPLNFTNSAFIRGRLLEAVEHAHAPVRLVVIEASGVTDIDYTGATVMIGMVESLRNRGIEVALARLSSERAQDHADRTGLLSSFGDGQVFHSAEEAVRAFKGLTKDVPEAPSLPPRQRPLPRGEGAC